MKEVAETLASPKSGRALVWVSERPLVVAVLLGVLSFAVKSLLFNYGLPAQYNPDEWCILKDPFKIALLYAHGDFSQPTNLFFWIILLWYGICFGVGRLFGVWSGFGAFSAVIAGESPTAFLLGRVLGALCSAAAVAVLYLVLARTLRHRGLALLIGLALALNPVDLVVCTWLKFDGPTYLMTAILVWALARYVATPALPQRRLVYVLALVAVSLRIDTIVFLLVLAAFDWRQGRSLRPLWKTFGVGIGVYCLVTWVPVAVLMRVFAHTAASGEVTPTFEQVIAAKMTRLSDIRTALGVLGWNLAFYSRLLIVSMPLSIIAFWPRRRKDELASVCFWVGVVSFWPLMIYPYHATRYLLQPLTYLTLVSVWNLDACHNRRFRMMAGMGWLLSGGYLMVQTLWALRTLPDPRREAGVYLMAQTRPGDAIVMEDYQLPGYRADVPEAAEELSAKSAAVKQLKMGTGETFRLRAQHQTAPGRFLVEIDEVDRYAHTPFASQWSIPFDVTALRRLRPVPVFFTSDLPLDAETGDPRRRQWASDLRAHVTEERVFSSRWPSFRLRTLLQETPYTATIYAYRLAGL